MLNVKGGFVYIITNVHHTVLYVGVTNDLKRRISEHKNKRNPQSFSARYNCNKLVYYNAFPYIGAAIAEEKRIKGGSRKKKIEMIQKMNPELRDLWEDVKDW